MFVVSLSQTTVQGSVMLQDADNYFQNCSVVFKLRIPQNGTIVLAGNSLLPHSGLIILCSFLVLALVLLSSFVVWKTTRHDGSPAVRHH